MKAICFPVPILLAAAIARPGPGAVVVVLESGVPAYAEAQEGLSSGLGPNLLHVVDLHSATASADLTRWLEARDTRAVVAVGSRAQAELQARKTALPVVVTMVLRGPEPETTGQVSLDVPLGAQLAALRELLPAGRSPQQRARVGVIRNPARSRMTTEALDSVARKDGFTLVVVDCDGPARLLKAVASLKGKVDFLLCLPDPDLYNAVTIQPLVLAAIEDRLPLIGFSPAFVRAGAAAGVYPDYRALGRQTADMVLRLQHGDASGGEESPAKLQIAVNQRVTRLLGLTLRIPAGVEVFR